MHNITRPLILFCAAAGPTASCRLLRRPHRSHNHHHHHHNHDRRPPAPFLLLHPSKVYESCIAWRGSWCVGLLPFLEKLQRGGGVERTDAGVRSRLSSSSSSSSSTSGSPSPILLKTLEGTDLYAAEEVVKKSRFVGYAARCSSWDEARVVLESVRHDHPKSRHVCFGYVSSPGIGSTERSSDDGEPAGTAGAPILGAIKGEGLSDVLCVVVRYFGGIKLGAGGLIRAYGGSARLVLRSARTVAASPRIEIRLSTMPANVGAVYAAGARRDGAVVTTSGDGACYGNAGGMELTISCDEVDGARLMEDIVDATRGGVTFM